MVTEIQAWELLNEIRDPEIPVISIVDLGIVKSINIKDNEVDIRIIPTYTSCPAMDLIKNEILSKFSKYVKTSVKIELSPLWTSDLITDKGKKNLKEFGIAPPKSNFEEKIECPKCSSIDTELISFFGSTACKAHYKCLSCLEPFDYFKCHR